MNNEMTVNNMKELISQLNKASEAYYNGEEIISNYEYDKLYDELVSMEKETGIILPDSPTQNVGAEVVSKLPKEKHEFVALSLAKTKDISEFTPLFNQRDGKSVVMWKMDGSTLQLTYDNGTLTKAVTRGNGEIGSVITHNAPYILGLPMNIPYKKHLVVRGEAVMSYQEFERINSAIENEEEKYKNPRNLANASISMLDSGEMMKRQIWFHAFKLVYAEDAPKTFNEQLDWLMDMDFNTVEHKFCSAAELEDCMNEFSDRVEKYEFPVDGLVVAANDVVYAEKQPGTGHNPNKLVGYAFKWKDETEETVLRGIEWSASRTGLLNPVALFDSVELEGTTVSRASLHNVSYINDLKLMIGHRITVYKANKIIPQLAENLDKKDGEYSLPNNLKPICPSCGSIGIITGTEPMVARCENPDCPAKNIKKFVHFCERDCMNVDGLSKATIEKFVDKGWLRKFSDLFTLIANHGEEISQMDGFGKKSVENLDNSIKNACNTNFIGFIHALGIPNIGKGQAKLLKAAVEQEADKVDYQGTYGRTLIYCLVKMVQNKYDFTAIDGFGEILANSLTDYFRFVDSNEFEHYAEKEEFSKILKYLNFTDKKSQNSDLPLKGKIFVITGSLNHYTNRDELVAVIEEKGGKASGSVSAKTSFLINNDVTSTSGKNKKAKDLGVPIISEEEFRNMI